jgi:hypothetical protein
MIAPSAGRQEYARRLRPAATLLALLAPDIFFVYSLPQKGGAIIVQAIQGVQAANKAANTGARITGQKECASLRSR